MFWFASWSIFASLRANCFGLDDSSSSMCSENIMAYYSSYPIIHLAASHEFDWHFSDFSYFINSQPSDLQIFLCFLMPVCNQHLDQNQSDHDILD
jgi:hypothetical protein